MPYTPCRAHGCPNLCTRKDKGFCDDHADKRTNWAEHQRKHGNRHQRGYGSKWNKIRKVALKRDNYMCVICASEQRYVAATDVDHIVPKSQGGTDVLDNLQSLCRACHKRKTATDKG